MDTLLEAIESTIRKGRSIEFSKDLGNLYIKIRKMQGFKPVSMSNALPFREDHFNEKRIVECIDFINKELSQD